MSCSERHRWINCKPNIFCNQEISGPNSTANIWVWKFQSPTVLHIYCSYWLTLSKRVSNTLANFLEPHGPSMYTLSMGIDNVQSIYNSPLINIADWEKSNSLNIFSVNVVLHKSIYFQESTFHKPFVPTSDQNTDSRWRHNSEGVWKHRF